MVVRRTLVAAAARADGAAEEAVGEPELLHAVVGELDNPAVLAIADEPTRAAEWLLAPALLANAAHRAARESHQADLIRAHLTNEQAFARGRHKCRLLHASDASVDLKLDSCQTLAAPAQARIDHHRTECGCGGSEGKTLSG